MNLFRLVCIAVLLLATTNFVVAQPTVFEQGDVAILGINANNNLCDGSSIGPDLISFVCFKDLTNGTTLDFTDNGWQRANAGFWGTTEGVLRITRTGATIPAGTVITIRINNTTVTGISPDANWSSISLNGGAGLNMNNSGDQIFVMQGGIWINGGTHLGTYTGTVLFAFSSSGGWTTFSGGNMGTGNSDIYPGMLCLSMSPTASSDWSKYNGPMTPATQRTWLDRINDSSNWSDYFSCAVYNSAAPVYQSGYSIPVTFGGFRDGYWIGVASNDWFDCENWENLRVPDATTDVKLRPLNFTNGPFVHALIDAPGAICESIDIQSGGALNIQPAGELSVQADVLNNGVLNSTGTISLESNLPSILSGSSGIPTRNLILNKAGGIGIQADTIITITNFGTLSFINGIVNPTGINRVDFLTNSLATGASNNSFVNGIVRKTGNQNFSFPVGNDGFYQPISIENITVTGSVFEARFFNQNGPGIYGYNWVPSINNVATCNFWTLDKLTGGDANVRLSWGNDDDCEINTPANLVVSRFDGTIWLDHGMQSPTGNATAGTILSSDLLSLFGPFALASKTNDNPLPVEWLDFIVSVTANSDVKLEWYTASEMNNDYFAVEHSADGYLFNRLGTVAGNGTTSVTSNYDFTHLSPGSGNHYYRIKQVDFNGDYDYSVIRHAAIDRDQGYVMQQNNWGLDILFSDFYPQLNVYVFDAAGRMVSSKSATNTDRITFSTESLQSGVYFIHLESGSTRFAERFVKFR